ncbi:MAG: ABC transporter substrate-binding protein [Candidatus Omnitrophica bacterium]|nr:ABC transporter substrate-binding protein [Candidatus Omnitrophota bacterium]
MKRLLYTVTIAVILSITHASYAARSPQRIISLGPSITRQLYLLGVEDSLIGCTIYCEKPKEAKEKERVANAIDVNLEKVISLNPDLVLATSLTNPKAIKKIEALGIAVILFATPENFSQLCSQFAELAERLGKGERAQEILTAVKDKVYLLKERVEGFKKTRVFIQVGAKPLFTQTRDSFINDLIEFAGGVNIASGAKSGFYSREKVIEDNPEVIIITTMGITGEEEKNIWNKYKTLDAVRHNRIYILDPYKFCSVTPVSFAETLEEMVGILHSQ